MTDEAAPARTIGTDATGTAAPLPPGQRASGSFPRFGQHLHHRAPPVPVAPALEVRGAGAPLTVPLEEVMALPRRTQTSDFHCVAGWSAIGLRWEGVPFASVFAELLAPRLLPAAKVTHVVFRGLDGYRASVLLEDALAEDVLLADRLDGRPLASDHGAPVRLVSPRQYGYLSTKHLCRIELHASEPDHRSRSLAMRLLSPHPRARVWQEERHRHLPGRLVRATYRQTVRPFVRLSALGSASAGTHGKQP